MPDPRCSRKRPRSYAVRSDPATYFGRKLAALAVNVCMRTYSYTRGPQDSPTLCIRRDSKNDLSVEGPRRSRTPHFMVFTPEALMCREEFKVSIHPMSQRESKQQGKTRHENYSRSTMEIRIDLFLVDCGSGNWDHCSGLPAFS